VVYVCPSSYYLQQQLLSPTFKQIGLMCLNAQRTIFTACYGYTFMVTMNALQLDLLQLVPTDGEDYRTEYNIIAANYSAVRYFVAPSKPCK